MEKELNGGQMVLIITEIGSLTKPQG
jgi:hypothetical protein